MTTETADWIVAYQEAFRAANPEHEKPIRVQLWAPGWYRIAHPGEDFANRKYRRKQIEAFTANLRATAAKAADRENAE
jgi:hypothetical protein